MGCIYDKNKAYPDKGPYIWIKYKDPDGVEQRRPLGRVNPKDLTKVQLKAKERELRRLARDALTKIEGDIVAGRYGLEDHSRPRSQSRRFGSLPGRG